MTKDELLIGTYAKPWWYFMEICKVPRPSKHEGQIQAWLRQTADQKSWQCRSDAIGNVVISVPGQGKLADCPPLILQGHMDMVCEKNADVDHDFFNDPIETHVDGEWLTSGRTTLGADNGVAMAYGLALASEVMPDRLPLELLFTIDEETGLTGALKLDAAVVNGKHVLNLDSEDDSVFIIGCAGGLDLTTRFARIPLATSGRCVRVSVTGLRGGHSGICIHENRDNAILVLGAILNTLKDDGILLGIVAIEGGNKRNAIPREASAVIQITDDGHVLERVDAVADGYKMNEPAITVSVVPDVVSTELGVPLSVLEFFSSFPNGVIAMEPDVPDLVRTSCSLGVAITAQDNLTLIASARSSSMSEKNKVGADTMMLAEHCGGRCEASGSYPGWEPYSGSTLVERAADIYSECFGRDPVIQGIHAGLEAGIIGDILDTRELLAFGPLIENAHSPEERLNIPSFEASYTFLKHVVTSPVTAR
ncbi:hypothetical protein BVX99_01860 [bacterium F16]|nr:hypothetical protein BVX99_01860 [bacterium F16]